MVTKICFVFYAFGREMATGFVVFHRLIAFVYLSNGK